MRSGRSLEQLVSHLEKSLSSYPDAKIVSPKYIPDRITGELREHDVVLEIRHSHHTLQVAIECRDRSRRVTVPEVEGFWKKCQDTGIAQGIIVSPKGFFSTALLKAKQLGIRTLGLDDVPGFPWLLAAGMHLQHRNIVHNSWTFFPKEQPLKPIERFSIVNGEGEKIPADALHQNVVAEVKRIPFEDKPGNYRYQIRFNGEGLFIRDDANGDLLEVSHAVVTSQVEITHKLIPFRHLKYTDKDTDESITDSAIAEVSAGDIQGQVMIVYDVNKGGKVMFIPKATEANLTRRSTRTRRKRPAG